MRRFIAAKLLALTLLLPPTAGWAQTFVTLGANTGTTTGTDIVCGANAKSAWTEFSASLSITAKLLWVDFQSEEGSPFILDVGTGAAASETVLVPDLSMGHIGGAGAGLQNILFGPIPVSIASGTRVVVRCETDSVAAGNETIEGTLLLSDSLIPELTSWTYNNYGVAGGADSKDTQIAPDGTTAHTNGSWAQLTATAASDIRYAMLQIGNDANGTAVTAKWLLDIGTGGAGSETVIVDNLYISISTTADFNTPATFIFPGNFLSGQRVAVRAQSTTIDATDKNLSVALLTISGSVPAGGSGGGLRITGPGGLVAR